MGEEDEGAAVVIGRRRELTPDQQAELDTHKASQNRAYIRENSDTLAELRSAEAALRKQGYDPGTGMPLNGGS